LRACPALSLGMRHAHVSCGLCVFGLCLLVFSMRTDRKNVYLCLTTLHSKDTLLFRPSVSYTPPQVMKLSPYDIAIEQAYNALLHEAHLRHQRPDYAFNYTPRRPRHVIPRPQPHPTIPRPVQEYEPACSLPPFLAKEKMV
jgi:hypothetical protein